VCDARKTGGLLVENFELAIPHGLDGVTERPFTHHEILRLIEPFARRGRHVDLAASDRMARRLTFQPIVHEGGAPEFDGAREILSLENPRPNLYRLRRTVTLATGEAADLTTEGPDAAELLDRIDRVPPRDHFQWIGDRPIARSYRLPPAPSSPGPPPLTLTLAVARLHGLVFRVTPSTVQGYPAEIELTPQAGQAGAEPPPDLPDDILAALGWDWKPLRRRGNGWVGAVRAPGREPERSRRVEAALETAVAHLNRTLAEPPHRFHERLVRARWMVVFRRMIPILVVVVLMAGAIATAFVDIPQDSMLAMLIFNLPTVLLGLLFTMREIPRLEFPPPPRASRKPSWFPSRAGGEAPDDAALGEA